MLHANSDQENLLRSISGSQIAVKNPTEAKHTTPMETLDALMLP